MKVELRENAKVAAMATLPDYMVDGLFRYIEHRLPPGSFLTSVLENDLRGACLNADDTNKRYLYAYVFWLYNFAPMGCWGSLQAVSEWLAPEACATESDRNEEVVT